MAIKNTAVLIITTLAIVSLAGNSCCQFYRHSSDIEYLFAITGYQQEDLFGKLAALAIDVKNSILYVADSKKGVVYAFGLDGAPRDQYGAGKGVRCPIGLAVDKDGSLYVAEDAGGPIKVISRDGKVTEISLFAEEGTETPKAGRLAFDHEDNFYVVDRTGCRIYVFDKDRRLKLRLGGKGEKRGQFRSLCDVCIDRTGRIYALDSLGAPVQVFDKKGKYLYKFGFRGEGLENLALPAAIFADRLDQIWVVDSGQHCLKVFDRSGTFLKKLSSYGSEPGALIEPIDMEIDQFGRIYVAEGSGRRVQVFALSHPYEPFEQDTLGM